MKNEKQPIIKQDSTNQQTALKTGFYYLRNPNEPGVTVTKENTDERYKLDPVPFASVEDIEKAELQIEPLENGSFTNICLHFNKKGVIKLQEGSAKALHQQIAIVIAGKLLYTVTVSNPITDPKMCITLIGFSEAEKENILQKVNAGQ